MSEWDYIILAQMRANLAEAEAILAESRRKAAEREQARMSKSKVVPDVPTDMLNLANAIDAQVPYVSATAPTKVSGLVWYDSANGILQITDGTTWFPVAPATTWSGTPLQGTYTATKPIKRFVTSSEEEEAMSNRRENALFLLAMVLLAVLVFSFFIYFAYIYGR